MAKIKTFELDRWSEPDEKRRVRHIGMADAKETFDRLQTHLELKGLLPDEYFLFSDELTGELPEFDQALCIPNFGASEGIYLDISLACRDKDGKRYFQNFATGKTLGETADDYYRMFRIAAECSLMLNGRGNTYEQKKVDIVLTEQEAEAVGTVVDMELCGHHPPEAEAILNSALEKIDRIAFAKVQTITCHGKDDYSLWSAEIPKDMLHSILHEACERVGTLDELMDAMNPKDGYEMRLFIQTPGRQFAFYRIPERLSNLEDYPFQLLAVSRPVDISPLLSELSATLTSSSDVKQKELLKQEIVEMGAFALSGEVVERQFYIKIWDRVSDGVERDLLQKLKLLGGYFSDSGIQTEILEQQDIVRLCNLVNNPAYVHLEDSGINAAIPILESVGVA